MKARWMLPSALLVALALAGCGSEVAGPGTTEPATTEPATTEPATTEPEPSEEPTDMDDTAAARTITGTLGGDAQLEGGCVWLDAADGTRYEVLWPEGYRPAFDPVRLLGPDGGVVARAGEELAVTGRNASDMVSICMVGTLFEATGVETG